MAKTLTGVVTSDVADKTITVTVTSRETHPIYRKQYTVTRKYAAHDEDNSASKGDKVIISESRPYSKRKTFKLDTIVEKSRGSIELKDEAATAEEIVAPKVANKKAEEVAEEK
ncbi:30S ribosomal protein S17 [Candidatus Saccharibacteria bacterium]|nr:30S ribosomal protein S17 [Candidatus Saccharibacteria bacterium]